MTNLPPSPWPCVHGVTSEQVDKRWGAAVEQITRGAIAEELVLACECCAASALNERCSKCL